MPSQRPYFLSSFLAAFRPQGPSMSPSTQHQHQHQQPNKHTRDSTATTSATAAAAASAHTQTASSVAIRPPRGTTAAAAAAVASPGTSSPGTAIPIPGSSRRRGSDSSSEGFRDVLGAEKWYIGGRTPGGEEKFFKLGVIRRVRSNDGLSLDRLSL
ncbi:hypothetical protein AK830_g1198 [Neonectria ditissima]|uniref:Uncharacterized protein n=1 Tax=Neonectria ditissima TaxID=78410 RepID=A0A0P7BXD7_9HYPO|nr:hypothetical protein AK830_g1198 [Neonectria ditissima]